MNMTQGNISRGLLKFSIPLILSGLLQQLYNIADAAIVGNFVGQLELGAVGATAAISIFFINIIIGLTKGLTILTSQLYGSENYSSIKQVCSTFVVTITLFSIIVSMAGIVLTKPLLLLINTPADIFELSALYLKITMAGIPFLTLYNIYGSMLRGIGDSRSSFIAIIVAAVVNISLNLIFVIGFQMSVEGVAYATVISQLFSALYLIWVVYRKQPILKFSFGKKMVSKAMFIKGTALGLPLAVQSCIMSAGNLMIQNVTNSFGTLAITAITTAYKIDSLCMLPAINLATAVSTFTGQNIGAKKQERVIEGFKKGTLLVFVVSCLTTSLVVFGSTGFMKFFGVSDEVSALGRQFLILCSVFYPVFGLQNAVSGFLQGTGDVVWPAVFHVAGLAVRIIISYTMADILGFSVIAYAEIASWIFTCAACYIRYRYKRKDLKKCISI